MTDYSDNLQGKEIPDSHSSGDHSFLDSLERILQANLKNEQFGVEDLASEMSLSRFQIYRKLNALTGQSISQYIREYRLKQAMQLLKNGAETVSEISYQVGFNSPAYFNKCFTEFYGITPGEVRKVENMESNRYSAASGSVSSAHSVPSGRKAGIKIDFWKELQRRNIFRAGFTYLTVTWLVLQIVAVLEEYFSLSPWIFTSILVLLLIGFPVALLLAWHYERSQKGFIRIPKHNLNPDRGIVGQRKPFTGLLTISGLILAILMTYLLPKIDFKSENSSDHRISGKSGSEEKSIAVLHFINLSGEEENMYFAEGIKEAILNHLSTIKGLRVSSRTAIEKYRESDKSVLEIGRDLEVTYILEGNVQKYEDHVRVTTRIVDISNDRNIWSKQYTEPLQNIFTLTTIIARDIASELQISLSPKEEGLLTLRPTVSYNAYDLYLRGKMYFANYLSMFKKEDLLRAESLYKKALAYDSTFALAYVGLGEINNAKKGLFGTRSIDESSYTDSVLLYATKAINLDPNLANAYALRGNYFEVNNQMDLAIKDQEKAISINPNLTDSYLNLGRIWFHEKGDPIKSLQYLKLAQFYEKNGTLLPWIFIEMGFLYLGLEDFVKAEKCFNANIQLNPGFHPAHGPIFWTNCIQGKFEKAQAYMDSVCTTSEDPIDCLGYHALSNFFMKNYEIALEDYDQLSKSDNGPESNSIMGNVNVAYIYLQTGRKNEGKKIMENLMGFLKENKRVSGIWPQIEVLTAMGEKEKALEKLEELARLNPYINHFTLIPNYHVFEQIHETGKLNSILEEVRKKKAEARKQIEMLEEEGGNWYLLAGN